MNKYDVVIGIEIHLELNTKTKMFSSAANDFHAAPNTSASAVDMAYPGTLPVLNKAAVVKSLKLAKALKMEIETLVRFDRKNYFYPDLPKGFQITQQYHPIGEHGVVPLTIDGETREISIERIHMEEDTAKSLHKGEKTLLNYNRAGTPLIEIVSDPVMSTGKEAAEYVATIQQIAQALDISDAKMEEGSLRADVNISLKPAGRKEFGQKVEIKNLNSTNNIQKAVECEIQIQSAALDAGELIEQATKRFDETKQTTVVMRSKSDAIDYKYFTEPNIPPVQLSEEFVASVTVEELPWEARERFSALGLNNEYVNNLVASPKVAKFFDSVDYSDKAKLAKVIFSEVSSIANAANKEINELNIDSTQLALALTKLDEGAITGKHLKAILPELVDGKSTVEKVIESKGMKKIGDESQLQAMIDEAISSNSGFVEANKDRKERVVKYILGQVMKASRGQADPVLANKLVEKTLGE